MLKRVMKIVKWFICIVLTFILIIGIVVALTPKPLVSLMQVNNNQKVGTFPENYDQLVAKVNLIKNIDYPSKYKDNNLDLYIPQNVTGEVPVIIWAHGGGFFRGDKDMAEQYPMMLAANGYAVVSFNYALVPDVTVFEQVSQVDGVWNYVETIASNYHFDMNKVILGGTSAGGFIVSQYLLALTNAAYAEKYGITNDSEKKVIGALLYSAPLDFTYFQDLNFSKHKLLAGFALWQAGWAITGERNWEKDTNLKQYNFTENISANLPPIFITDGNKNSFEGQAKAAVKALSENGNDVTSLFFDDIETGHSYMLKMDTAASQKCQEETLRYLKRISA